MPHLPRPPLVHHIVYKDPFGRPFDRSIMADVISNSGSKSSVELGLTYYTLSELPDPAFDTIFRIFFDPQATNQAFHAGIDVPEIIRNLSERFYLPCFLGNTLYKHECFWDSNALYSLEDAIKSFDVEIKSYAHRHCHTPKNIAFLTSTGVAITNSEIPKHIAQLDNIAQENSQNWGNWMADEPEWRGDEGGITGQYITPIRSPGKYIIPLTDDIKNAKLGITAMGKASHHWCNIIFMGDGKFCVFTVIQEL